MLSLLVLFLFLLFLLLLVTLSVFCEFFKFDELDSLLERLVSLLIRLYHATLQLVGSSLDITETELAKHATFLIFVLASLANNVFFQVLGPHFCTNLF